MWRDGLEQSETELLMASEASAVGNDSEQQLPSSSAPLKPLKLPDILAFICSAEGKTN